MLILDSYVEVPLYISDFNNPNKPKFDWGSSMLIREQFYIEVYSFQTQR